MIDPGIWIGIGALLISVSTIIGATIIDRRMRNPRSTVMEVRMHIPYGANGWQLCMGLYGVAYGAGLLWPELVGASSTWRLVNSVQLDPIILGSIALSHGVLSVAVLFFVSDKSYWSPMACAVGAMVWTMIGITQIALSAGQGVAIPVWGIFELLGGIGYSVATMQRARQQSLPPEE
jgi:hypothetical protein